MRTYLLTGGAGTIGRALAKRIASTTPEAQIEIFDDSEQNLVDAQRTLGEQNFTYQLGDVRDANALELALDNAETVVHLAARKHVSFTGHAPNDTISTNVEGTMNVTRLALRSPTVKRLVNVSTDKACQPTTLYGATKLIGEQILWSAARRSKGKSLSSVRFGNVLGSSGSVLDKWLNQARERRPIDVTNPLMRRFVMTEVQAADLILSAERIPEAHGAVLAKEVPSASLHQLLRSFTYFWKKYQNEPVEIRRIQPLPFEKLDEDMLSREELSHSITRHGVLLFSPAFEPKAVRSGISSRSTRRMPQASLDRLVSTYVAGKLNVAGMPHRTDRRDRGREPTMPKSTRGEKKGAG